MSESKYITVDPLDMRLSGDEFFSVPTNIFPHLHMASKKSILVLLSIIKHNMTRVDYELIIKETSCDKEDIDDGIRFWVSVGVLTENEASIRRVLRDKLTVMLGRNPFEQEIDELVNLHRSSYKTDISLIYSLIDLGQKNGKKTVSWLKNIYNKCLQNPAPEAIYEDFCKYFSLINIIKEGYALGKRELTMKEKEKIMNWARRRIPLDKISDAYSKCMEKRSKISIQYMDRILSRMTEAECYYDDPGY